jgi:hypothetical protein
VHSQALHTIPVQVEVSFDPARDGEREFEWPVILLVAVRRTGGEF